MQPHTEPREEEDPRRSHCALWSCAAFANSDPSVLFGAMAPDIQWNEAEGTPLADRNPYVGAQAVGEGVFGPLLAIFDGFTVTPDRFVDGGDDVIVLGRYGGTMKQGGAKPDAPL